MDELVHIAGGYLYWKYCDFRVNPENGNLPQRIAALPHLAANIPELEPDETPKWYNSEQWAIASALYNQPEARNEYRVFASRVAMAALVMLPLSLVVFFWSRELWGIGGAFLSLILITTSPTMLAHGPLATSDMCFAGVFALSLWLIWKLFSNPRWELAAALGVVVGVLALSKHTFLIFPLVAIPLFVIVAFARGRERRWWRHVLLSGIGVLCIAYIIIWSGYCFNFSGFSFDAESSRYFLPLESLAQDDPLKYSVLGRMAKMHVLPEPLLYGIGHVFAYTRDRSAFLAGNYYSGGNVWFFPLAMLLKTSLPVLIMFILGAYLVMRMVLVEGKRRVHLFAVTPILIGVVVVSAVCMSSDLNIGHRHLLPVYPLLFVLSGAVVSLGGRFGRYAALIAGCASVAVAASAFPNYLSFFNSLAGGSDRGFRFFTDSTVDWGQDLSVIENYVRSELSQDETIYVAYFGPGDSPFLRSRARILRREGYPFPGRDDTPDIAAGIYIFSATAMIAPYLGLRRPWSEGHERMLWRLAESLRADLADLTLQSAAALSSSEKERLADQLRLFYRLRYEKLRLFFLNQPSMERPSPAVLVFRASEDELRQIVPMDSVVPEAIDVGRLMMTLEEDSSFLMR